MDTIRWNRRGPWRGLALGCVLALLAAGCGLVGGQGSLAEATGYQAQGKYRAAYIEAKKVLQHDAGNGKAWLLLGKASLRLGDPKDALNSLEKARANGVPQARWMVPTGQALLVTRQFDKLLDTLSPEPPLEAGLQARVDTLRGDAQRNLKQPDQAKQSYRSALKLDPGHPRALVGLARLAAADKDPAAADAYVDKAIAAAPESPQAWVTRGDLAFERGDLAAAEAAYRKVLGFKHADWLPQERFYARVRLAGALARQHKYDDALASIEVLEKEAPKQPRPHFLHATVLYQQGHLDKAVEQLQLVLQADPDNPHAQLLMGAVNYAKGNDGQAQMYLSNVMGMDPDNVPARKLLALTLYRQGRSQQALATLRPAVPGQPSDARLLAMLQKAVASDAGMPGRKASVAAASSTSPAAHRAASRMMAQLRDKHPDKAVETAAAFAADHPDDSAAHLLYGTALVADNQLDRAREEYEKATSLDPDNVAALLSLGGVDSLQRKYKSAESRFRSVLDVDPKNVEAMVALGRLAAMQGDKAAAIKQLRQAIAKVPGSTKAHAALIMLYTRNGQFDQASKVAEKLAAAQPDNPVALNALGAARLNAGQSAKAVEALRKAVKLAPDKPGYRVNLARAQIVGKDLAGAESNLAAVVEKDPRQVQAASLLAFVKLQKHDLPGAIALARKLQGQDATRAAGFALEGDLYMADKTYAKAAEAYRKGLQVEQTRSLVIKRFLALSRSGAAHPGQVLRDWVDQHADDAASRMLLAEYYLARGQDKEAAGQYEQVLKNYPSNVMALNNLAWIYVGEHDPAALETARRAHDLAPSSPSVQDTYAWALLRAGRADAALPLLTRAAKAAPKVPDIQYHLAMAKARTGDKAGARATLEPLLKSGARFQGRKDARKLLLELGGAPAHAE